MKKEKNGGETRGKKEKEEERESQGGMRKMSQEAKLTIKEVERMKGEMGKSKRWRSGKEKKKKEGRGEEGR